MRILFLSVPTGQGHHQTCKALEEYCSNIKGVECLTLDVVDNVRPLLADSLSNAYLLSTKMTPGVYGRIYGMAERRDYTKTSGLSRIIKTVLNRKLMRVLRDYKPDVIVSSHVFSAIAVSYLKRKYPFKAKTVAIITDFTVHPFWEETSFDYYITATELLDFQVMKKGHSPEKIKPFGIPISPKFAAGISKEEARAELGLEDKFTVLFMMGSMGYGHNTMQSIKQLDSLEEDFQLITVCGRNTRLKQHIDRLEKNKTILNFGYVNNVDLLMDAADCIITKPGGLSTSEALAKGLPIIMLNPIPGQEDRNEEFMLNNGLAMSISETFTVDEAIYQLINYPHKINQLKENMKFVAKPNSAKEMGEFLLSICDKK